MSLYTGVVPGKKFVYLLSNLRNGTESMTQRSCLPCSHESSPLPTECKSNCKITQASSLLPPKKKKSTSSRRNKKSGRLNFSFVDLIPTDEPLDTQGTPVVTSQPSTSFRVLVRKYSSVRGEVQSWSDHFFNKTGRRPKMSDVEVTQISWLIERFHEYLMVRTQVFMNAATDPEKTERLRMVQEDFTRNWTCVQAPRWKINKPKPKLNFTDMWIDESFDLESTGSLVNEYGFERSELASWTAFEARSEEPRRFYSSTGQQVDSRFGRGLEAEDSLGTKTTGQFSLPANLRTAERPFRVPIVDFEVEDLHKFQEIKKVSGTEVLKVVDSLKKIGHVAHKDLKVKTAQLPSNIEESNSIRKGRKKV